MMWQASVLAACLAAGSYTPMGSSSLLLRTRCQAPLTLGMRRVSQLSAGSPLLGGGGSSAASLGLRGGGDSSTRGERSVGGSSYKLRPGARYSNWDREASAVLGMEPASGGGSGREGGGEPGTESWFDKMRKENEQPYEPPEEFMIGDDEQDGPPLEGLDLELLQAAKRGELQVLLHPAPPRARPIPGLRGIPRNAARA